MQLSVGMAISDSLKKHYIIHEFGHALGLGHEHQCSKFWQNLYPFVYTELVVHDQTIGGAQEFGTCTSDLYYTSDLGPLSGEYDPQSIMHNWLVDFDKG